MKQFIQSHKTGVCYLCATQSRIVYEGHLHHIAEITLRDEVADSTLYPPSEGVYSAHMRAAVGRTVLQLLLQRRDRKVLSIRNPSDRMAN
jgi:hypothetical protein